MCVRARWPFAPVSMPSTYEARGWRGADRQVGCWCVFVSQFRVLWYCVKLYSTGNCDGGSSFLACSIRAVLNSQHGPRSANCDLPFPIHSMPLLILMGKRAETSDEICRLHSQALNSTIPYHELLTRTLYGCAPYKHIMRRGQRSPTASPKMIHKLPVQVMNQQV